jgi:hypothetical protein
MGTLEPVLGGGHVQKNGFDVSKADPDSDRTRAFACPFFPNSMRRPRSSSGTRNRPSLCSRKVRLAALDRPVRLPTSCKSSRCNLTKSPNVFVSWEVRAMAGSPRSMRRSTSSAHSSASLRRRNVSLTYFPFRRTWARQDPELSLVNVANVCAPCALSRRTPRKGSRNGVEKSAHDPT